jgi:spore germination cell wall hydrolase CwlJ-like protein
MLSIRKALERMPEGILLALMGWGEARGEGPVGILAVMWVAKNRADKKDRALKDVLLQPYQFSCFNAHDPNLGKMLSVEKDDPDGWGAALAIAKLVLSGFTRDPTGGASHFYATYIPPPYWAKVTRGWTELTVIGRHIFGIAR